MPYKRLVKGFQTFKEDFLQSDQAAYYKELVESGQKPEVLFVACSDSRIDPANLTNSKPGDFFGIRNVAAMVPPHQDQKGRLHGTTSAIEFAVRFLKVKHIIVMGHSACGGVRALATGNDRVDDENKFEFLNHWLSLGTETKETVETELNDIDFEKRVVALEQSIILMSLKNLLTYDWIKRRCDNDELEIHGWYFDMGVGQVYEYNIEAAMFEPLDEAKQGVKSSPELKAFLEKYASTCNC